MDTSCAPLVADLFLFCYERDFMTSLSDDNQTDIIDIEIILSGLFSVLRYYLGILLNL